MDTILLPKEAETVDFTIQSLFSNEAFPSFTEVAAGLVSGELPLFDCEEYFSQAIVSYFFSGINELKNLFFYSLILAFFFLISGTKKQTPAVETGFFLTYLLMVAELVKVYIRSAEVVQKALEALLEFLNAFLPAYCTGLAVAAGGSCATAFYGVAFLAITIAGTVFGRIVLPLTGMYFLLSVFNRFFCEDLISRLAGVFCAAAKIAMKVCIAGVLGIGSLRGMLAPAVDGVRRSGLLRIAGAIPVVGDLFDGATQTVMAAGGLVKNAIGMAGAVFVFVICFIPALKIGIACALLRVGAALLQPVSDKRIGDCLELASKTHKMLFRILMYTMLLFLLLILLFAAFTGTGGKI